MNIRERNPDRPDICLYRFNTLQVAERIMEIYSIGHNTVNYFQIALVQQVFEI